MIWIKATDWVSLGFQQITSLTGSTALTVPGGATCAFIQAETKDVRWRDDGVAPTAAIGNILGGPVPGAVENEGMWYRGDLSKLRFIETAASAKLNVSYYR